MKEKPKFVYFNGEITPYENAVIHSMTPCVRYGALVFEGIRGYWNEEQQQLYLFRLNDHSKRLLQSAKMLRMQNDYSIEFVSNSNIELVNKLNFKEDIHIRQMVYVDGDGPLESAGPVGMINVALPRGRSKKAEKGLNVSISSWIRIDDTSMPPRIKAAANYQNGRLAKMQAKLDGYDGVILLNKNGKVSEGPGACVFIVRNSTLITPPVTSGILESVTRDTLIRIAANDLNMEVIERDIDRTELYIADEAFFCGSGAEITPIVSVDKHTVGDGNVGANTKTIWDYYLDVVRGKVIKYENWLTAAYPVL